MQNEVNLIKAGERVGQSESTLLNMLNISPFTYGLVVENGQYLSLSVQKQLGVGNGQYLSLSHTIQKQLGVGNHQDLSVSRKSLGWKMVSISLSLSIQEQLGVGNHQYLSQCLETAWGGKWSVSLTESPETTRFCAKLLHF